MIAGSSTIRVALLIQHYLPVVGGAQRQIEALLPLLADRGIECQIITRKAPATRGTEMRDAPEVRPVPSRGPGALRSITYTVAALRVLRSQRPDVIHCFDLLSPTTTGLIGGRLLSVPVITKVLRGGALGDVARLRSKPAGSRRLQWAVRDLDRVIAISGEIREELLGAGFSPAQVVDISNGVDLARFNPDASAAAIEVDPRPRVLFTGRLSPEKGLAPLAAAWKGFTSTSQAPLLQLIGDGPERGEVERIGSRLVEVVGPVGDVASYLHGATALVLPSSGEGLSNSMLEAMAAGVPPICTAVGGALDVIEHGRNGLLVEPNNPLAIVDAVRDLLRDPAAAADMGRQARVSVEQHFDLADTADRLTHLYRELVRRSPAPGDV